MKNKGMTFYELCMENIWRQKKYFDEMKKDWLKLSFFPIENTEELATLRSLMTPFMKNICRCYETKDIDTEEGHEKVTKTRVKQLKYFSGNKL